MSLTKKPINPTMRNPMLVAATTRANSARSGFELARQNICALFRKRRSGSKTWVVSGSFGIQK